MGKGYVFCSFFLLFVSLIAALVVTKTKILWNWKFIILLTAASFFVCELRKNAIVVPFIVFFICWLVYRKSGITRQLVKIVVSLALLIAGFGALESSIARQNTGGIGEASSVPIQQVGSVMSDPTLVVADGIKERLYDIQPSAIWDQYQPNNADPIKGYEGFFTGDTVEQPIQFYKDWVKLGLKYPSKYAQAFWDLEGGYIVPTRKAPKTYPHYGQNNTYGTSPPILTYGQVACRDLPTSKALRDNIETCYISAENNITSKRPDLTNEKFVNLVEQVGVNFKNSVAPTLTNAYVEFYYSPVLYGFIFENASLAFWLMIVLTVLFIVLHCKSKIDLAIRDFIMIMSATWSLWLITFLSSPVALTRYVYPILLCMPFLSFVVISRYRKTPSTNPEQA